MSTALKRKTRSIGKQLETHCQYLDNFAMREGMRTALIVTKEQGRLVVAHMEVPEETPEGVRLYEVQS